MAAAVATPAAAPKEVPQETPVKVVPGAAVGEVQEALQNQLKVLSWRVEQERAARIAACARAERAGARLLRPLAHPAAPRAALRRQHAHALQARLDDLRTEWTLFVARSGLVKFPSEPANYARALQQHKEKQRAIRRDLEERLQALQAEALGLVSLHRPWRCVEADFAHFPAAELTAALTNKAVDIGTIKYHAESAKDDTIYVTPSQLAHIRELVEELKSDKIELDLKPLDQTVCAA